MIAEKEISAEDTLNSSDFPSDEEIVKNICDVHGSCGEDYKKESSESEAASRKKIKFRLLKIIIFTHLETQKNNDFKIDRG